ncbi:MAG: META domain-containing protein [Bacteroidetes bacterium]|nr:META domain-containing protein [Bacteroidota bacterium]
MNKFQLPAAALLLGVVLSANTCSNKGSATNAAAQAAGKWVLVSINGQPQQVAGDREQPFLNIDSLGANVNGFAGCNRIFGSMVLHGDSMSFPGLAATKMYCQESQQLEDQLLQALNNTRTFTIQGDELKLKGGKELAVFRRTK